MSQHADDVEIAGITPGFCATRSLPGSASPVVAVWHDDGDHDLAFMLPRDTTVEQINQAIAIYERGYRQGEVYGVAKAQRTFREAIGLGHL
ncbi:MULTISPECIES: hypothetical protein [Burkholderia]|uniref:hypothetical protein n=1 Tax=Burkholderia TaxID=32008 RepID=UPI00119C74E7|nr:MULTISPECIES: hypothetical protein [Burkholderia]TWC59549.1 hypothetical protein FB600_13234 [Burkholderia sp. SJZ089]TWC94061.1 hypothetical protein FBX98_1328 [Burkholderia sp. SJZ115]TWC96235.1 hypothetical protein FB601_1328 [Burkholderia sp. SJZ091]